MIGFRVLFSQLRPKSTELPGRQVVDSSISFRVLISQILPVKCLAVVAERNLEMRAALATALVLMSSAAWAQCSNVNGMVCAPGASASMSGDATIFRGKATERVSGVSSVAAGQRVVVADKNGSLSLGGSCQVTVPAFSSVTLSNVNGMVCANGVRTFGLNGNIRNTTDSTGLGQFSGQACPSGQVYDPNARRCFVPTATQDLTGYYIGGVLILGGVIGAIILANDGDKTVSP